MLKNPGPGGWKEAIERDADDRGAEQNCFGAGPGGA